MFALTTLSLLVVTLILYIKWVFKKSRSYLDSLGIPYIEPKWLFGNVRDTILKKKPQSIAYQEVYEKFPSHKVVGFFYFNAPVLVLRDLDLIKTVLIKEFTSFPRHDGKAFHKKEFLSYNLFTMRGEEWKALRTKLTPTFTASKMKFMLPLVEKCAENLKLLIEKENLSNPNGIDSMDLGRKYSTDVVTNCAFGMDMNSLVEPESEYKIIEKRVFAVRWQPLVRLFFPRLSLKFVKSAGLQFVEENSSEYFINLIKNAIKHREENNIVRGDFLDILIAMKNQTESQTPPIDETSPNGNESAKATIEMTPEMMASQCFLFLSGGYTVSANVLSWLLFDLAQYPHIQEKVRAEVLSMLENNNGELTYELLSKMTYLNMVICESSRKNSAGGFISRINAQTYKFPELKASLSPKTTLIIPVRAIHYDPTYYEKPDKFYPEHFTAEAIAKRPHSTFMPFGDGPRNCIAARFVKMEMMVAVISVLKNFSIEVAPKTKVPVELYTGVASPLTWVKGGIWLKFRPLNSDH